MNARYSCAGCGKPIEWGVKTAGHRWGLWCLKCWGLRKEVRT